MRRALLGAAGVILAFPPVLGLTSVAYADDSELTISHVEPSGGDVKILVSVPEGVEADLDAVGVTIGNVTVDATAEPAGEATEEVRRTTILAIDTSDSMGGPRFAAAKAAAEQFLQDVPADVYVGIVTFNSKVTTALQPSLDRDSAQAVIDGLALARGTRLYEGVIAAARLAGTDGQRSLLVLSDGKNSNKVPLADAQKAIEEAEVRVDAVALDQVGDALVPLQTLADAGSGSVIPSDPEALTAAFTAEADSLARQLLVTAPVPAAVEGTEANVAVTVPAGGATLTATAFSVIRGDAESAVPDAPRAEVDESLQIPEAVMYGGIAAIGVGMVILFMSLMSMATAGSAPRTVEQRIAAFGTAGATSTGAAKAESSFNLEQAKDAAASVLHRNRGLEARIEHRLEGAGSEFKSAEWLLLHSSIAILCGLGGLLLSSGSLLFTLLAVGIGVLIPWMWLGWKRKRRIAAFNSGLADTLQLISGSLSAGMSLAQSIDSVVKEGNEPIASEFKRVLVETRLGVPLEAALEGIAARIQSVDFAWVVMAIRIQREVGGNLAELLTTVAGTLRERDYLRRQVKSLSAEGRLSAYILIALPIAVLGYLLSFRGEYIKPLYTEPMGFVLIFVMLVLMGMGWFTMSRIVKVEV